MVQARGAPCVSVGPWCWGPIGPSRELKTQALNCLPNRGSSSSPRKCLSRPAGFRLPCRAALAYSIFHFSSPRPSTLATRIEASWAIWGESALHRIAHDATSSS